MSNLTRSNLTLSVSVPLLLGKKSKFKGQDFHSLESVFFGLADRLKPIAICSSWRVQK